MNISVDDFEAICDRYLQPNLDHDITIRLQYSGRGMYGKSCLGIVGELGAIMDVYTNLISSMTEDGDTDFIEYFNDVAMDDMGTQKIMYWKDFNTTNIDTKVIDMLTALLNGELGDEEDF